MQRFSKNRSLRRKQRVRGKMQGTATKPRVSVYRSNKHLTAQAIDDVAGKTIAAAHDLGATSGTKTERATQVGAALAADLKKKKVAAAVFDRGAYRYHGRVRAVAEALREKGINV